LRGRPAHDHWMNSPSSGQHTAHYSPVIIATFVDQFIALARWRPCAFFLDGSGAAAQVYCSAFIGGCHGSDRLARLRQTVGQSHGLAGEHAIYDRVHAALLLSLAGVWATGAPASAVSHTAAFECDLDHTRSRVTWLSVRVFRASEHLEDQ
jgi:hypothetical protein